MRIEFIQRVRSISDESLRNQKFIVDRMYRKLSRWLRILGYDTIFDPLLNDSDVLALASSEKRFLITRDEDLERKAKKLKITTINADGTTIEERLVKVQKLAGIELTLPNEILSLCTICNNKIKSINKEAILDRIFEGTEKHYDDFWICTNENCKQIFWRGPHWVKITQSLKICQELMNS